MVAQLFVNDLYCNAEGSPRPTGDGIVDANTEDIKDFNDQGPTLGIGLCSGSPTWAVIMSNHTQLRTNLTPELMPSACGTGWRLFWNAQLTRL